jgi:hypothetical protein
MTKNDAAMAALARRLGATLIRFARDRRDDDKKQIAVLHTELCAAYRAEIHAEIAETAESERGV